ncbi:hypothetical protein ABZZ17_33115 [Streptomyces sp. NPDC006512]|uniref:hypothetical protein n=1 Tax=Streptomyces sp. NPDC006512 TaxID=3154307 RepID=UPI0033B7B77F
MIFFLLLAVLLLAIAGACAVLRPLLPDLRRDKGREWAGVVCLLAAAMGFCLALAAFVSGHLTGFGNMLDPVDVCGPPSDFGDPGQARARVLTTVSVLPVSVVCADSPGGAHVTEMVAAWVNPTIAAGSGTALLGLLLAPVAPRLLASAVRRRT